MSDTIDFNKAKEERQKRAEAEVGFTNEELQTGDGDGIPDLMRCPECTSRFFCLVDDDPGTIYCSNCQIPVDAQWDFLDD